ncbi:MAG: DUF2090 domain-containing protein [Patescibacteria group bacterium]
MANLFVLAFDHRATFATQLLGYSYPRLTKAERKKVTELKRVVFDGFLHAWRGARRSKTLAVLVDEEFGMPVIRRAKRLGLALAIPVEKSGQDVFNFEHGARFGAHLKKIKPTFAKALVRYDVARKKDNHLQRARLLRLSRFCQKNELGFLIEILLTGSGPRRAQLTQTMREMIEDGINPAVWKLEGLPRSADWKQLRRLTEAELIMLGRGESRGKVLHLLRSARESGVASGFAIGRTIFFEPLRKYLAQEIARAEAVRQISKNYRFFINLWQRNTP